MADTTSTTLAAVEFHGATLVTTLVDGVPHVALKPLAEAIGLDWNGQYQRATRDPVLSSVMCVTHTTGGDGKRYEMTCLPLKHLNGWLFGVDANRVAPEVRDRLIEYQRECYDVLADYWQKGGAINPRQSVQSNQVGKATGLTLSQLVGLQDQAWKLIQRLERTVVAELRHSLYEQLQDVYADMGKTAPPLSAIGQQAPEVPHATTAFWTAYEALTAVGVRLNHHRDPALIAVNLRQFHQAAAEHKVKVPSRKELLAALPLSRAPKFCEQRVVNSGVTGVSVHCHVFRAQEGGAA